MPRPSNHLRNVSPEVALDRIDFALLARLQDAARTSNKELAGMVGLAPSTCFERVRRLERSVIRGYRAQLDPLALGLGIQAMISVHLRHHAQHASDAFVAHLDTLPEVVGFFSIGGEIDFLVHVAVEDVAALQDLTQRGFTDRDEVDRITTSLVFEHRQVGYPVPR